MSDKTCRLCSLKLPKNPVVNEGTSFCCHGCQAVYQILFLQGALQNFQEHPLFQQAVDSGLISNPFLLEEIRGKQKEELDKEKIVVEVEGLWCPSCAQVIQLILGKEKGIAKCTIDYSTDLGVIEYYPQLIGKERIFSIIKKLGYQPKNLEENSGEKKQEKGLKTRFAISAFCALNVMMFSYPIYAGFFQSDLVGMSRVLGWLSLLFSLPILLYSGLPLFRRFFSQLRVQMIGMEALISIGVFSSFSLSLYHLLTNDPHLYFDTMSVIVTLVLLGRVIENRAKFSAKSSLLRLTRSIPNKGRRWTNEGEEFVPLKEVKMGEILKVLQGEKIPLDGVVVEGGGYIDESLMTGESFPIQKGKNSPVIAGSILTSGIIKLRVEKTYSESTWQKLVTMIEEELINKTPYIRLADKVVQWFVPAVLGIAFLVWATSHDFSRVLSLLLISCPCALGIAAPLAESKVLHTLSELGALVKNRGCLYLLGKETLYAFDKTGTVTEGKITVGAGLEKLGQKDRQALKTLTQHSNHPISRSISYSISEKPTSYEKIEEVTGLGVKGEIGGHFYYLGSKKWMDQLGVPAEVAGASGYFVKDGKLLTRIELVDQLRPEIPKVIQSLKPQKTVLLSGDHEKTVKEYAKQCGFDTYFFEQNPLQKREKIDQWRKDGEVVCFIGDGINDSPSIAGANIGISVNTASDMTVQVSDIVLTKDSLALLSTMHRIAKKGRRIVHQNLFWAFGYNVIGIALAGFGYLNPIFSAGAMALSSLFVILNSQRT